MIEILNQILNDAIQDERNEKLCLIEDIIKVKKLLFGFGVDGHKDVIEDPAAVVDALLEMPIKRLEVKYAIYSAAASRAARDLIGWKDELKKFDDHS